MTDAVTDRPERILIIKHGALGDMVLATGPFAAIRDHHASAHITLLTTKPYTNLMQTCGWFDEIWIDDKPKIWQGISWLRLRKMLRDAKFDRVYDLQHTDRSHFYFRMFGNPKPEWSGIVKGASHPHANPAHEVRRPAQQLLSVADVRQQQPFAQIPGNRDHFEFAVTAFDNRSLSKIHRAAGNPAAGR